MDIRPVAILRRLRGKALRYIVASLLATALTQLLIWFFHGEFGWGFATTNVTAVALTVMPAYVLNRYWVWASRGDRAWRREVGPFWLLTFAGLVLSTLFAFVAEQWTDATWAVSLANISGFGVLWLVKFLVLDEYLFAAAEAGDL